MKNQSCHNPPCHFVRRWGVDEVTHECRDGANGLCFTCDFCIDSTSSRTWFQYPISRAVGEGAVTLEQTALHWVEVSRRHTNAKNICRQYIRPVPHSENPREPSTYQRDKEQEFLHIALTDAFAALFYEARVGGLVLALLLLTSD